MVVDIAALAAKFGDSHAITHPDISYSYAELATAVAERARKHSAAGVIAGLRIGLVAHARPDTLIDVLALFDAGCMIVPLSPDAPRGELEAIAAHCRMILWDSEPPAGLTELRNAQQATSTQNNAVLGLLSSGSTGTPKLVLRSAEQVRAALDIYARSISLSPADRVLALVPMEHSYGFNNVFLSTLTVGGCIVFPGTNHPRGVMQAAQTAEVTIFPAAPLFFDLMVKFATAKTKSLPHVRACISVGTALAARIHESFTSTFNLPLWQSYGSSEAGPLCLNRDGTPDGEVLALGVPCEGVEFRILDDDGQPIANDQVGEIMVRSPAVGIGYEGATDGASRIENDCFYTGDLGCMRDGILFFRGRRKLLIAAAGHKVDPAEVENVLLRHPKVRDAAVVAHKSEDSREVVKALVVKSEDVDSLELMDYCSQHLAAAKVPRLVEFRDSLPRNSMGKLQRDQL